MHICCMFLHLSKFSNMSVIELQLQLCIINFSNGQLTTAFDSQRQRPSVCISARKEVSS